MWSQAAFDHHPTAEGSERRGQRGTTQGCAIASGGDPLVGQVPSGWQMAWEEARTCLQGDPKSNDVKLVSSETSC